MVDGAKNTVAIGRPTTCSVHRRSGRRIAVCDATTLLLLSLSDSW